MRMSSLCLGGLTAAAAFFALYSLRNTADTNSGGGSIRNHATIEFNEQSASARPLPDWLPSVRDIESRVREATGQTTSDSPCTTQEISETLEQLRAARERRDEQACHISRQQLVSCGAAAIDAVSRFFVATDITAPDCAEVLTDIEPRALSVLLVRNMQDSRYHVIEGEIAELVDESYVDDLSVSLIRGSNDEGRYVSANLFANIPSAGSVQVLLTALQHEPVARVQERILAVLLFLIEEYGLPVPREGLLDVKVEHIDPEVIQQFLELVAASLAGNDALHSVIELYLQYSAKHPRLSSLAISPALDRIITSEGSDGEILIGEAYHNFTVPEIRFRLLISLGSAVDGSVAADFLKQVWRTELTPDLRGNAILSLSRLPRKAALFESLDYYLDSVSSGNDFLAERHGIAPFQALGNVITLRDPESLVAADYFIRVFREMPSLRNRAFRVFTSTVAGDLSSDPAGLELLRYIVDNVGNVGDIEFEDKLRDLCDQR